MRHGSVVRTALVATALALGLAGCAASSAQDPGVSSPAPVSGEPELSGELSVYAAASLQAAFDELAAQFEQRHPSLDVHPLTYDGSSTLATQIVEGAPADVFASADERNMQKVVDADLASEPELFATNTLTLVVPAGDPGGVDGLDDLADPDLTVVLCAVEAPCGAASATLLSDAGVKASVDSYEQNVTAVLTKVAAGEADAGLVYVTDASTTSAVDAIEVDGGEDVVNRYPIVTLTDAANPRAADAFVRFVLGDEARRVLSDLGFGAP
ncbi:molybdate ABC transporter substrate-binding protein [Microbacterium sp. B35-30]|uniref:molybdate ABC transporter substrate-binding protein n=1 Tax=Microbacterium sp. B35-30 TaxID=1962642 RepID=UPI0013D117D2|nr:molybdate ABC transporter substrate-binding protein [Microbacterium sp. B35-30]KAF2416739.1 molybdate ABC transporter substrate-binding protein [Microbacterium sp. B35-30]